MRWLPSPVSTLITSRGVLQSQQHYDAPHAPSAFGMRSCMRDLVTRTRIEADTAQRASLSQDTQICRRNQIMIGHAGLVLHPTCHQAQHAKQRPPQTLCHAGCRLRHLWSRRGSAPGVAARQLPREAHPRCSRALPTHPATLGRARLRPPVWKLRLILWLRTQPLHAHLHAIDVSKSRKSSAPA